jgi:hypothetical protein
MNYSTAKKAYEEIVTKNKRWVRLEDGRIATKTDCLNAIKRAQEESPEDYLEQCRRDV